MDAVLRDSWHPPGAPEPAEFALVRSFTRTRDHFRLLAMLNMSLLPLAMLTFGDRFHFFRLPLSDLGMPQTAEGLPNIVAFLIFILNMIASGAIMVSYAVSCRRAHRMPHREWKAFLALVAAGGFIVGIFPHDRFHYLHMVGCGVMVGALWFLANLFSGELHAAGKIRETAAVQLVLQLTVVPYAVSYVLAANPRQALQKLAILGLFVSLSLGTRTLREAALAAAIRQSRLNVFHAASHSDSQAASETDHGRKHRPWLRDAAHRNADDSPHGIRGQAPA